MVQETFLGMKQAEPDLFIFLYIRHNLFILVITYVVKYI